MSHGQSMAERDFSIDKEVEVENIKNVSLISQRMVYDLAMSSGMPFTEGTISNGLLKSSSMAHSWYVKAMENFIKGKIND